MSGDFKFGAGDVTKPTKSPLEIVGTNALHQAGTVADYGALNRVVPQTLTVCAKKADANLSQRIWQSLAGSKAMRDDEAG